MAASSDFLAVLCERAGLNRMSNTLEKHPPGRCRAVRRRTRRLVDDRRGNVATIFALSLLPIMFLTGMAFDFTRAAQKQVLLNAAADAAALAAVTPAMMAQSDANAIQAAPNIFNGHAFTVDG